MRSCTAEIIKKYSEFKLTTFLKKYTVISLDCMDENNCKPSLFVEITHYSDREGERSWVEYVNGVKAKTSLLILMGNGCPHTTLIFRRAPTQKPYVMNCFLGIDIAPLSQTILLLTW